MKRRVAAQLVCDSDGSADSGSDSCPSEDNLCFELRADWAEQLLRTAAPVRRPLREELGRCLDPGWCVSLLDSAPAPWERVHACAQRVSESFKKEAVPPE